MWQDKHIKHQESINSVKIVIDHEVVLAYPNFSEVFEIYIDASSSQLGTVLVAFVMGRHVFPTLSKTRRADILKDMSGQFSRHVAE